MKRHQTLWSSGTKPDAQMVAYTVGDDRELDTRLLRWDVLGSLGHVEALVGNAIISARTAAAMRAALRAALRAVDRGELRIGPQHEDGHSAVEFWLTEHFGDLGERLHTGRSRNDQVALDLRLWSKDAALTLHQAMLDLTEELLVFATEHRHVLWPGYTHQRVAMPSSAGAWSAGYAEQLLDAADAVAGIWPRVDRSPLGSAAGYGVPLPLDRERAAKALGFSGLDQVVTSVQSARGQHEAALLFWCTEAAHPAARLSTDVILFTSEEFGWLTLPADLATGSSIMPQKRNPDLFELSRARTAALTGDLATVMSIKTGLAGGYHRDFQLLKAPLFRGVDRTREMLAMLAAAVPRLGVVATRGAAALHGGVLATDEVMRRVGTGVPFRAAYREVAAAVKRGDKMPSIAAGKVLKARSSTGGLGNLGLTTLKARRRAALAWNRRERQHFDRALSRLITGRRR